MSVSAAIDLLDEFETVLNEVIGIYFDTDMGFDFALRFVRQAQEKYAPEMGKTIDELDRAPFRHVAEEFRPIHDETVGQFKNRMAPGGKNCRFASTVCISMIYSYWEDGYREPIACALGTHKAEILSDIMGDIRLLRNSIIHHRSIALPEIGKCKVITKFKEGDTIYFDRMEIVGISDHIKKYLQDYRLLLQSRLTQ